MYQGSAYSAPPVAPSFEALSAARPFLNYTYNS
jgi:hypothetical protein